LIEHNGLFIEIDGVNTIPDEVKHEVIRKVKKLAELVGELAEIINVALYNPHAYVYPDSYTVTVTVYDAIYVKIKHSTWWTMHERAGAPLCFLWSSSCSLLFLVFPVSFLVLVCLNCYGGAMG